MSLQPRTTADGHGDGTVSMLVYGDSGVGKTRLLATMPGPVFVISTERGGMASVAAAGYDVEYVEVESYEEALQAAERVRRALDRARADGGPAPWATVALDGLTALDDLIAAGVARRGGALVGGAGADEMLSPGGYGVLGMQHMAVRERVLRLPGVHVVLTALAAERDGRIVPAVSGKQGARIPAFCQLVLHAQVRRVEGAVRRLLTCRADGRALVKDRYGLLRDQEPMDCRALFRRLGLPQAWTPADGTPEEADAPAEAPGADPEPGRALPPEAAGEGAAGGPGEGGGGPAGPAEADAAGTARPVRSADWRIDVLRAVAGRRGFGEAPRARKADLAEFLSACAAEDPAVHAELAGAAAGTWRPAEVGA